MVDNVSQDSRNPADDEELPGALRFILRKFLSSSVDDMLPCIVIASDRANNVVTVKPLIQRVKTNQELVERQQIASIPVFNYGAGGVVMAFNIKEGDLGWIHANDRDISNFLQTLAEAPPNTKRIHDFSDGVFFPDAFRNWVLDPEDEENFVLQSTDGTKRIAIWNDRIKITTPLFEIESDDTQATGTITAAVDVIADGVSLKNHTHSGVQPGGGNTGPPN